jgi:hypothetical protein
MGMRTRYPLLAAMLMAVLAGGTLAGCGGTTGDDTGQPGETAQSGGAVSNSPGQIPPLPPSGRVSLPPEPDAGKNTAAEITITGIPEEGVESGCVVMRSGDKMYNLLGGDPQLLMSGRTVIVRGRPTPGLMTTCQQGTPFQVTEVRLA